MCGIAGVLGSDDIKIIPQVKKMTDTIAHRGMDDEFYIAGAGYCMGARRLSIIDLQSGRQPLTNEDGSVIACQNGEIYNYQELQYKLEKLGHTFKSRCDTEVIVHMYEEYGDDFVKQLNGMFAIALWDDKQKRGLLIRDRMGEKPLYYFNHGGCLYFASEIKALLTLPFCEKRINLEALHHYLSYKHVPNPMTIFKGIWMLQPAHYLKYEPKQFPRVRQYWELSYSDNKMSEPDISDELLRLLKQGIKRRLVSDVPVGIFLSGGVDSSLVTAIASELSDKPVETFTLTYPVASVGKKTDKDNARLVSSLYGTNHHEEPMESNHLAEYLPKIIGCFDQPFSGVVSTYFLANQMRKHLKVGLTGDGADELFGNYLSHRMSTQTQLGEDWEWRSKLFVFTDSEKRELYSPEMAGLMKCYDSQEHLRQYFTGLANAEPLNRMLGAEFKGIFPDQVLEYADKLSMAHNLELRAAYLDHEFVEFIASLPSQWKIRNGVTKYILKKVAERYLPTDITQRTKEGFLLPITEWYYYNLRNFVEEALSKENLKKHNFFNYRSVRWLIDDFYGSPYDYRKGNKLHSLIAFQVWWDKYIGKQAIL